MTERLTRDEQLEPIEQIDPLDVEISGPYQYDHETHPCFRLGVIGRLVAVVYITDGDEERALAEAQMIKEAFRLGGKEIDRIHYATANAQSAAPRWRHKKRGSTYVEVGRARLQASDLGLNDMQEMVVYRSEADGSLWVRPTDEFEDGRFAQIGSQEEHPMDSTYQAIEAAIAKPSDRIFNETCKRCGGSGDHPGGPPGNQMCSDCDGRGFIPSTRGSQEVSKPPTTRAGELAVLIYGEDSWDSCTEKDIYYLAAHRILARFDVKPLRRAEP